VLCCTVLYCTSAEHQELGCLTDLLLFGLVVLCLLGPGPGPQWELHLREGCVRRPPEATPFPTFFAAEDEDRESLLPLVADMGEEDPFLKE